MNNLNQRINRLIGQIEGIRRMVEKKRDCGEIVQQVLAAREALSKIGLIVMKEGICRVGKKEDKKKLESLMEKAFRV